MMANLSMGDQSEASIAATAKLVQDKMERLKAIEKKRETIQSIQQILIKKFTERVKEENPELVETAEEDAFADMEPEERFKQMILTKILTDEVVEEPAPEDPGYYGEKITELKDFFLPGESLDYKLIDWEIIQRCFNQREMLKRTHNCHIKSPDSIFNKFSCMAEGCIYDDGDCFYCEAAWENQVANKKSLTWVTSNEDECTVVEADKIPCPDFEETPLANNKMKLLSLLDPKMNQLMTILHVKKMEQQCEEAGCCYQRDLTPIKRAIYAGDDSISQLLAEKMIPNSGHMGCFKKAEVTPLMTSDRCMPKREEKKCGQHDGQVPISLGPDEVDSTLSDETNQKQWMVAVAKTNGLGIDELKCSGVLVCDSWLLTSQSCIKQNFKEDEKPVIYIDVKDTKDLSTGKKVAVSEVVHHSLYEESAYTARAHVGNDLTLIRLSLSTGLMPICLPKTTDNNVGENVLMYTMGMGQRESTMPSVGTSTLPKTVKIDKFATQANYKCVSSSRRVDFLGSICLRSLADENHLPESNSKYTTGFSAVSHGDRGGAGARYHEKESAWVLDGIIAGGPSSLNPADGPTVLVHVNENLSWIEDVTNGCCQMVDFLL